MTDYKNITLEDYLAGQALTALIAKFGHGLPMPTQLIDDITRDAYRFAGSMMLERITDD